MKNFRYHGECVTLMAPDGGVEGGDMVIAGRLVGVVAADARQGADFELILEGVFEVPCKADDDIDVGDLLYLDEAGNVITATKAKNTPAGFAMSVSGNGDNRVDLRLTPGVA